LRASLLWLQARFFFQPRHLGREPTDLSVEVFGLLLVGGLVALSFAFALEEGRQAVKSSGFPLADLVGMQAVLRSDLSNSPVFPNGILDDFGFESGRVSFSHGTFSLTYFGLISCLNSWGHYNEFHNTIAELKPYWLLSYDAADEIKTLYSDFENRSSCVELLYTAARSKSQKAVKELVISNLPQLPMHNRLWRTQAEWECSEDQAIPSNTAIQQVLEVGVENGC
jgi:hypothetical protein